MEAIGLPIEAPERDAVHVYFGLSYASFAAYPRVLLQSMPDEWQARFVALMHEYDQQWADLPRDFMPRDYRIQPVVDGKLAAWRRFRLPHYSRGRARVARDGTVTGERFPVG